VLKPIIHEGSGLAKQNRAARGPPSPHNRMAIAQTESVVSARCCTRRICLSSSVTTDHPDTHYYAKSDPE
jgi:hypothetical protein